MRAQRCRPAGRWLVIAVSMLVPFMTGCDPTVRATIEDGIINVSQSLFASFLRALIELGEEAQQTSDGTSNTGT